MSINRVSKKLVNKLVVHQMVNKGALNNESKFTQLLFQENVISRRILSLLNLVEVIINNSQQITKIKITDKDTEKYTLGQLKILLTKHFNKKDLIDDLSKFIEYRNNITHKLLKYDNYLKISSDCIRATTYGEKVIHSLNANNDELFKIVYGK